MKPRARQRRAVLRDRRRDNRDAARYGDPLIRALTGWDLYIARQYADIAALERVSRQYYEAEFGPIDSGEHAAEIGPRVGKTPAFLVMPYDGEDLDNPSAWGG